MKKEILLTVCILGLVALCGCAYETPTIEDEFEMVDQWDRSTLISYLDERYFAIDLVDMLADHYGGDAFLTLVLERTSNGEFCYVLDAWQDAHISSAEDDISFIIEHYGDNVVEAIVDEYGIDYLIENYG